MKSKNVRKPNTTKNQIQPIQSGWPGREQVHPNTKYNLVCQVETTGVVVRLNESSRPWDGSWHYCYMSADNFLHWFLWMLYCLKQGPPVKYWVQPGGGAFLSTPHWNWEKKYQNYDLWGYYPRTNTEPIQSSVKYERLMSLKRFMRHLCPEGRE